MANGTRYNITAIIRDKRGRPLSRGTNSYVKTHRIQAEVANRVGSPENIYLHAEIDAIIKAGINIKKAHTMQIFRINYRGEYKLAKPCIICQALINTTPIKLVEHT